MVDSTTLATVWSTKEKTNPAVAISCNLRQFRLKFEQAQRNAMLKDAAGYAEGELTEITDNPTGSGKDSHRSLVVRFEGIFDGGDEEADAGAGEADAEGGDDRGSGRVRRLRERSRERREEAPRREGQVELRARSLPARGTGQFCELGE